MTITVYSVNKVFGYEVFGENDKVKRRKTVPSLQQGAERPQHYVPVPVGRLDPRDGLPRAAGQGLRPRDALAARGHRHAPGAHHHPGQRAARLLLLVHRQRGVQGRYGRVVVASPNGSEND